MNVSHFSAPKDADIGECTFKWKYFLSVYEIQLLTTTGVKRQGYRIEYKCWKVQSQWEKNPAAILRKHEPVALYGWIEYISLSSVGHTHHFKESRCISNPHKLPVQLCDSCPSQPEEICWNLNAHTHRRSFGCKEKNLICIFQQKKKNIPNNGKKWF